MTGHLTISEEGRGKTSTLTALPSQLSPDVIVQVTTRFYDPEEGRYTSETGTIRLTPDQQDELAAALTSRTFT